MDRDTRDTNTTTRRLNVALLALACAGALTLGGCARTMVENRLDTMYDPADATAELDFWHHLPGRSAVTNDEGLHGVLLMTEGADNSDSYEARIAHLKELGWIPKNFDEPPEMAMQRGVLAMALAHAMDIDGGIMFSLTNKSPRYATRELQFIGLMGPGTEQMVISGVDYVGVMSKAQDYMLLKELAELRRTRDAVRRVPVDENVDTPFRESGDEQPVEPPVEQPADEGETPAP